MFSFEKTYRIFFLKIYPQGSKKGKIAWMICESVGSVFLSLSTQNLEKTGLYQLRTEQRYQNITASFASEGWEKR